MFDSIAKAEICPLLYVILIKCNEPRIQIGLVKTWTAWKHFCLKALYGCCINIIYVLYCIKVQLLEAAMLAGFLTNEDVKKVGSGRHKHGSHTPMICHNVKLSVVFCSEN